MSSPESSRLSSEREGPKENEYWPLLQRSFRPRRDRSRWDPRSEVAAKKEEERGELASLERISWGNEMNDCERKIKRVL